MGAKEETQHIRPAGCICDPFDLAALGHMTNCPCYNPFKAHKTPTCYVIRKFGITDEAQVRAIWMWSGLLADDLWGRASAKDPEYQRRGKQVAGLVVNAFGEVRHDLRDALREALQEAIAYCRETTL